MLGCFKRKGKKYVLIYYPLTNYDMRIIVNESKVVNNFCFHNIVNLKTPLETSGMWLGRYMWAFSCFGEKLFKTTPHL